MVKGKNGKNETRKRVGKKWRWVGKGAGGKGVEEKKKRVIRRGTTLKAREVKYLWEVNQFLYG